MDFDPSGSVTKTPLGRTRSSLIRQDSILIRVRPGQHFNEYSDLVVDAREKSDPKLGTLGELRHFLQTGSGTQVRKKFSTFFNQFFLYPFYFQPVFISINCAKFRWKNFSATTIGRFAIEFAANYGMNWQKIRIPMGIDCFFMTLFCGCPKVIVRLR